MDIQDKSLTCTECGQSFVFTSGEQKFYQEKGFGHEPRRCKDCRGKRKGGDSPGRGGGGGGGGYGSRRSQGGGGGGDGFDDKPSFTATCSACGGVAKLSFQPKTDRPVYCRSCFQQRQNERSFR